MLVFVMLAKCIEIAVCSSDASFGRSNVLAPERILRRWCLCVGLAGLLLGCSGAQPSDGSEDPVGTGGDGTGGSASGDGMGGDGASGKICDASRFVNRDSDFDALVAEGCVVIQGDLRIFGISYSSLDGLQSITKVEAEIFIGQNESLQSLEGLEGLTSAGRLNIISNNSLSNLAGLENLASLGTIGISISPVLTRLGPLHDWPEDVVTDDIQIALNPQLPACEVEAFDMSQTGVDCTDISCQKNDGICP